MWILAPTLALEGENASLRYALRLARNLALQEARRALRTSPLDPHDLDVTAELAVPPDPPPDPALRAIIADCLSRLPKKPREAIAARLGVLGAMADRDLALRLRMSLNTFLQNVVRARRHLADCLASRGVTLPETRS